MILIVTKKWHYRHSRSFGNNGRRGTRARCPLVTGVLVHAAGGKQDLVRRDRTQLVTRLHRAAPGLYFCTRSTSLCVRVRSNQRVVSPANSRDRSSRMKSSEIGRRHLHRRGLTRLSRASPDRIGIRQRLRRLAIAHERFWPASGTCCPDASSPGRAPDSDWSTRVIQELVQHREDRVAAPTDCRPCNAWPPFPPRYTPRGGVPEGELRCPTRPSECSPRCSRTRRP